MTTTNENTPAPVAAGNEGSESFPEHSADQRTPVVLRMNRRGHNTRDTYGTWAGDSVPQKTWAPVLMPLDALVAIFNGKPVRVIVSPEDIKAHDREARARRRRRELDRRVQERLAEYEDRIRAEVEAELAAEEGNR